MKHKKLNIKLFTVMGLATTLLSCNGDGVISSSPPVTTTSSIPANSINATQWNEAFSINAFNNVKVKHNIQWLGGENEIRFRYEELFTYENENNKIRYSYVKKSYVERDDGNYGPETIESTENYIIENGENNSFKYYLKEGSTTEWIKEISDKVNFLQLVRTNVLLYKFNQFDNENGVYKCSSLLNPEFYENNPMNNIKIKFKNNNVSSIFYSVFEKYKNESSTNHTHSQSFFYGTTTINLPTTIVNS